MRSLGVLIGLLALGVTWPALADEKFDPNELRVITPSSATSKCIGNPKTPICAVETFLACGWRLDMRLCNKVGIYHFSFSEQPETVHYRILKVRILKEPDIPKRVKNTDWMRPGNAEINLKIVVPGCGRSCMMDYYLRPTTSGWEVVSWSSWGDDT